MGGMVHSYRTSFAIWLFLATLFRISPGFLVRHSVLECARGWHSIHLEGRRDAWGVSRWVVEAGAAVAALGVTEVAPTVLAVDRWDPSVRVAISSSWIKSPKLYTMISMPASKRLMISIIHAISYLGLC